MVVTVYFLISNIHYHIKVYICYKYGSGITKCTIRRVLSYITQLRMQIFQAITKYLNLGLAKSLQDVFDLE